MDIDYSWDLDKEATQGQKELEAPVEMEAAAVVVESSEEEDMSDFKLDIEFYDEEAMWQSKTGYDRDSLSAAIETVIFMSDRPINIQKIKATIDAELPLRVVHECVEKLQQEYEVKHHGIRLMEVAEGYQFRTKAIYSKIVQKMFQVNTFVLSPSALEVLAIIAYRQPISKTQIETIRGVDSSHIVRALMDKRLVKMAGRSEEELGKPSVYATTQEFLEIFNLKDLSELPAEHELKEMALSNSIGGISDIREVVKRDDIKRFEFDEIDELDQLSQSIRDISADTSFTKSLQDEDKKRTSSQTENGEKQAPKTAFDILEEFIIKSEIAKQNKDASESVYHPSLDEIKTALFDVPEVTDEMLLTEGEIDQQFEELFGEDETEIEADLELQAEDANDLESEPESESASLVQHHMIDEDEEWLEEDSIVTAPASTDTAVEVMDEEEQALEEALNKAFANLGVWKDDEDLKDKARGLDLDLNFLQDDLDQSNQ